MWFILYFLSAMCLFYVAFAQTDQFTTLYATYPIDVSTQVESQPELYSLFDTIIISSGAGALVAAKQLADAGKTVLIISNGALPPAECFSQYYRSQIWVSDYVIWNPVNIPNSARQRYILFPKMIGGYSSFNLNTWDYGTKVKYNEWNSASVGDKWAWQLIQQLYRSLERTYGETRFDGFLPIADPVNTTAIVDIATALEELKITSLNNRKYGPRENPGYIQFPIIAETTESDVLSALFVQEIFEGLLFYDNVYLSLSTEIVRINFNGDVATGVDVNLPSGQQMTLNANYEIILGGGAPETVRLLYSSGFGDETILNQLNVPVIRQLPALGKKYIMLPLFCGVYFTFPAGTLIDPSDTSDDIALEYLNGQFHIPSGIYMDQFKAFLQVGNAEQPNVAINFFAFSSATINRLSYFLSGLFQLDEDMQKPVLDLITNNDILFTVLELMVVQSEGEIVIEVVDGSPQAVINSNMFSVDEDMQNMLTGFEFLVSLSETDTFANLKAEYMEISVVGCADAASDIYYECLIRELSVPSWQTTGGAVMGPDEQTSVVDENLLVYGSSNLYIMNSAIIPYGTGSCSSAPDSLIGKHGANYIINTQQL